MLIKIARLLAAIMHIEKNLQILKESYQILFTDVAFLHIIIIIIKFFS